MVMASSILQRCRFYYPKSLIRNYSLIVKYSYASMSSFERSRMQIVSDTTWSSQQLLPSQVSPWLMLIPKDGGVSELLYEFYDMRANKVMSFEGDSGPPSSDAFKGSSHGWLAEFDRSTRDLSLYNPISQRRVKLPTMDTLPLRGSPGEGAIDMNDKGKLSECIVKKVILSSSDPDKDESCVAMMLYGADNRLACVHPARGGRWYPLGSRHWQWDKDSKRTAISYQDVAYSAREKLFFCITKDDELEAWDSTALQDDDDMPISINDYGKSPPWPRRGEREFYLKGLCSKHRERYLVVAEPYHGSSQLFLVLRHKMRLMDGKYCDDEGWEKYSYEFPLQTLAFDVYKFDVEKRELVHMDRTLDGLALFVGKNHSFAVKAGDFDGLKPDSIYFTDSDPQYDRELNQYGGDDNGVYNYEDGTFSSCYYPSDDERMMIPAHIWFSPLHIDHKLAS